jgi:uncharacterized protein YukE
VFSKGADVDALRDSAGRMASFGREVDGVRAHGQRAVSTMQRVWRGPDLQQLVERWRRVEHDLHRISTEFDRLSRRLHDNADLQHRSSGSAGGAGSRQGGGVAVGGPASAPGAAPAGAEAGAHLGGPPTHGVGWAEVLGGSGPDGGRPLVTPGVPQPLHAMGWGQWIGSAGVGVAAFEPLDAVDGPVPSAAVTAAAAHDLGLPIR